MPTALLLVLATLPTLQDSKPGKTSTPRDINKNFLDPGLKPEEWLKRFEIESREVFASRDKVLKALQLRPGSAVADVGSGTGLYLTLFSKAVGKQGRVFAVDISPRFVEFLKDRTTKESLTNVEVVQSDEQSAQLKAGSVDHVFVCDTYHHFEFHVAMLQSIRSALRPGGTLTIVDFEKIPGKTRAWLMNHVRADKSQVRREVELAGFEFVAEPKIEGFEENYMLRFRKPATQD